MKKLALCVALLGSSMAYTNETHRYDHRVKVVRRINEPESMLSRVPRSFFKTVRHHPFFTALAIWAIIYSPKSIYNHPIVTALIAADLLSEFSLHMLKEY